MTRLISKRARSSTVASSAGVVAGVVAAPGAVSCGAGAGSAAGGGVGCSATGSVTVILQSMRGAATYTALHAGAKPAPGTGHAHLIDRQASRWRSPRSVQLDTPWCWRDR